MRTKLSVQDSVVGVVHCVHDFDHCFGDQSVAMHAFRTSRISTTIRVGAASDLTIYSGGSSGPESTSVRGTFIHNYYSNSITERVEHLLGCG